MELRFASTTPRPVGAASSCRWCGFFAPPRRLHGYLEEDGSDAAACRICHAARHVADVDAGAYRLVWAEEVSQPNLAHLCRVAALVRATMPQSRQAGGADALLRHLSRRADALQDRLRLPLQGAVEEAWEALDETTRARLLKGLRLWPVHFSGDEVRSWMNDDTSLSGYGRDFLDRKGWFASDLSAQSA